MGAAPPKGPPFVPPFSSLKCGSRPKAEDSLAKEACFSTKRHSVAAKDPQCKVNYRMVCIQDALGKNTDKNI